MLALAGILSLFSAVLAADGIVYCDPPDPNHPVLSGPSCDAAVSQIPATVDGVDFTIHREGYLVPAQRLLHRAVRTTRTTCRSRSSRGNARSMSNWRSARTILCRQWSTPRIAARDIILHCVLGGDGGPPGRGGHSTYDVIVVKVEAFERYLPMYRTIL